MKTRAIIKKFFQGLLVLALALVLVGLGKWQLDRAELLKKVTRQRKLLIPRFIRLEDWPSYGTAPWIREM
jgi:hypothetical protein